MAKVLDLRRILILLFFVRRLIFYLHFLKGGKSWKLEKKDVHKKGQLRIIDSASFAFRGLHENIL